MTDAFDTTLPDSVSADSQRAWDECKSATSKGGGYPYNTKPSCSDIYIQIPFPDVAVETYVPPQEQFTMLV